MSEWHIERIIANTINDTARGDPDALAARIVAALAEAGYRIAVTEDAALGSQPFDELTPERRPQDPYGDGRGWTFRLGEPILSPPCLLDEREGIGSVGSGSSIKEKPS
jgi:hypothetical protein